MSERVSILFRNQDSIALQTEKGAETLRRACIAATITGTYANTIFGDHLFIPLVEQIGFDAKTQEEQLRQFLYKNFHSLKNTYDDGKSSVIRRMSAETYDRSDNKDVWVRIDDSVSAIAQALKNYCPPGKESRRQNTLFRMCQKSIAGHVKGASKGNAYRSVNKSILLANQHSWRYLEKIIGYGASEYLSTYLDAARKYGELFPKDDKKNNEFAVSYSSPLLIQQRMLCGECIVHVETMNGPLELLEAVEKYWMFFTDMSEKTEDKSIATLFEEVRAKIDCMSAILAYIEFDTDDPNVFTIRIPNHFWKSAPTNAPAAEPADSLRILSSEQAMTIAKTPRMCLDHASDLMVRYCEIKKNLIYDIISTVENGHSVLISGDAGWGKSSALIMAYLRMVDSASGLIPFMVNTSALAKQNDEPTSSIPLAYGNYIDIRKDDNVVLFIDSVDEYFPSDSIHLANTLMSLAPFRLVISGRTKISKNLKEWLDVHIIEIVPETDSYVSDLIDSYSHRGQENLKQFLSDAKIYNPMMIAMSARYANPTGGIGVWNLFSQTVERMVLERLDGIRQDNKDISVDDVIKILEEYAWTDYRDDSATEDRIDHVSEILDIDRPFVSRSVMSFTDAEGHLLHSMIRDYLVSEWVFRQASKHCVRNDLYDKLLGSGVQRMIGYRLSTDQRGMITLIEWYKTEITRNHNDDREDLLKAVVMCYLARVVISADTKPNSVRRVRAFFDSCYNNLLNNPECPQMMVVCDTLVQKGRMDVEENYVELLEKNQRFSEICHKTYMTYAGDIDLRDIKGDYSDTPWMDVSNTASMLLRTLASNELRHMFLMRADITLMGQLLEMGYSIDSDILTRICNQNLEAIVDRVKMNPDFVSALNRYKINTIEYFNNLSKKLKELVNLANSRSITRETEKERLK